MKILVVGAGPSGSIAAYVLARDGHDVTIVERKSEPEKPVICGEFFPTRELAGKFIPKGEALDLSYKFLEKDHIMAVRSGMGMVFEDVSKIAKVKLYIISRYKFINNIVGNAVKNGAKLKTSTTFLDGKEKEAKLKTKLRGPNGVEYEEFDFIIGADAYPSSVARAFNLPHTVPDSDLALTITAKMVNVDYNKDYVYILFSPKVAPGAYAWIFPSSGHFNVGVGIIKSQKKEPLQNYLERFMKTTGYFTNAKPITSYLGKPLPVGGMNPEPARKRVYLTGDAAWLVVPTNGGGINNALVSGVLAARSIENHGINGAEHYRKELWRHIGELLQQSLKYRYKVELMFKKWNHFKNLAKIAPSNWIFNIILGKKTLPGWILLHFPL